MLIHGLLLHRDVLLAGLGSWPITQRALHDQMCQTPSARESVPVDKRRHASQGHNYFHRCQQWRNSLHRCHIVSLELAVSSWNWRRVAGWFRQPSASAEGPTPHTVSIGAPKYLEPGRCIISGRNQGRTDGTRNLCTNSTTCHDDHPGHARGKVAGCAIAPTRPNMSKVKVRGIVLRLQLCRFKSDDFLPVRLRRDG